MARRLVTAVFAFFLAGCGAGAFAPGEAGFTQMPSSSPPVSPAGTARTTGDLAGTYEGGGTNPDGTEYRVRVTVDDLGGYVAMAWSNGTSGYGLRNGDVLAASFGGDQCGIVLYTIASDYRLKGSWLSLEQLPGTEDATPDGSRSTLEGAFDIRGTNADGGAYSGTMSLTARGDLWRATWQVPGEMQGIGVVLEDTLAIAYGGSGCGVVSYRSGDGTLDGLWGYWDTTTAGTETISR